MNIEAAPGRTVTPLEGVLKRVPAFLNSSGILQSASKPCSRDTWKQVFGVVQIFQ